MKSSESQNYWYAISFQEAWDTLSNHRLTQDYVNYVSSGLLCQAAKFCSFLDTFWLIKYGSHI